MPRTGSGPNFLPRGAFSPWPIRRLPVYLKDPFSFFTDGVAVLLNWVALLQR
jgi:hypothetical protein